MRRKPAPSQHDSLSASVELHSVHITAVVEQRGDGVEGGADHLENIEGQVREGALNQEHLDNRLLSIIKRIQGSTEFSPWPNKLDHLVRITSQGQQEVVKKSVEEVAV